jgi:hypothetical protein
MKKNFEINQIDAKRIPSLIKPRKFRTIFVQVTNEKYNVLMKSALRAALSSAHVNHMQRIQLFLVHQVSR